jgi:hypothetical protein
MWLALHAASEPWDEAVPAFVEHDFRKYLDGGILARRLARARCPACGQDFVFPPLPVRQWVLSVPKRLRYFLQREPTAVNAVLHSFLRSIEAALRARTVRVLGPGHASAR